MIKNTPSSSVPARTCGVRCMNSERQLSSFVASLVGLLDPQLLNGQEQREDAGIVLVCSAGHSSGHKKAGTTHWCTSPGPTRDDASRISMSVTTMFRTVAAKL